MLTFPGHLAPRQPFRQGILKLAAKDGDVCRGFDPDPDALALHLNDRQRDLGPDTTILAERIPDFDPGPGWTKATDATDAPVTTDPTVARGE